MLASFYDSVLRELLTATGAALFVGNAYALVRRRRDGARSAGSPITRARPGSPVRGESRVTAAPELGQAPLARTVTYAGIGFVVMAVGLASIVAG